MATWDNITLAQARAIAYAALRTPQLLQEVEDGQAGPLRPRSYTADQIDAALNVLTTALADAGYASGGLEDGTVLTIPLNGASQQLTFGAAGGVPTSVQTVGTTAVVNSAQTVICQNSAGTVLGNGSATVVGRALSNVKLPATVGAQANASSRTIAVTNAGTSLGNKAVTFTVALGVITAISVAA